ncbi:sema domain, transmembrane domain (TM), and cytoplasmic domain, (semaphorin) 6E isoform X1, partial [Tachysurus ichikawai]
KTSPTSASPTIQGPALPKGPSVSEKGTRPAEGERGGRGSPGLEPISVEMEGKGAARGSKSLICLLGEFFFPMDPDGAPPLCEEELINPVPAERCAALIHSRYCCHDHPLNP